MPADLAGAEAEYPGIARLAERQRREVKRRLREHLLAMSPIRFEQFVGRLLGAMGYENVTVTRRSGDAGIDVTAVQRSASSDYGWLCRLSA